MKIKIRKRIRSRIKSKIRNMRTMSLKEVGEKEVRPLLDSLSSLTLFGMISPSTFRCLEDRLWSGSIWE
jgi:hypothetical protein